MKRRNILIFAIFVTFILLCSTSGYYAKPFNIRTPRKVSGVKISVPKQTSGDGGGGFSSFFSGFFVKKPPTATDSVIYRPPHDPNIPTHYSNNPNQQINANLVKYISDSTLSTHNFESNIRQPSFFPEATNSAATKVGETANTIIVAPTKQNILETAHADPLELELYNLANQPDGYQLGRNKNQNKQNQNNRANNANNQNTENNNAGGGSGDKHNNGGGNHENSGNSNGSGGASSGGSGGDGGKNGNNGGGDKNGGGGDKNNKKQNNDQKNADKDSEEGVQQPENNPEETNNNNNTPPAVEEGAAAAATSRNNNDDGAPNPAPVYKAPRTDSFSILLRLRKSDIRHSPYTDINVLNNFGTETGIFTNFLARMAISNSHQDFPLTVASVKGFVDAKKLTRPPVTMIMNDRNTFLNDMVYPELYRVRDVQRKRPNDQGEYTLTIKNPELQVANMQLVKHPTIKEDEYFQIKADVYNNAEITFNFNPQTKAIGHLDKALVNAINSEQKKTMSRTMHQKHLEIVAKQMEGITGNLKRIRTNDDTNTSQFNSKEQLVEVLQDFSTSMDATYKTTEMENKFINSPLDTV